MSSMMGSFPFFHNKSTTAVRRLLAWKQGDEEEKWAEKAIDALVKKLKNQSGAMAELEKALSHPDELSKCVTIPRSQDGRLQVSHRKGLPHVIYCRVWRWPDLQSHHELKALPCCAYPFDATTNKDVCINPYHYQRVESHVFPPVLVPRQNEYRPQHAPMPFSHFKFDQMDDEDAMAMPSNVNFDEQHSPTLSHNRHLFSPMSGSNSPFVQHPPSPPYSPRGFAVPSRHLMDDDLMDSDEQHEPKAAVFLFEETDIWCSVQYFELNRKVGEPFHAPSPGGEGFTIDGFTDPTVNGKRFSLGQLTNIIRDATIENTRKHIGRGVHICYVDGDVYAECLSSSAVFIQSRESNFRHGLHPTAIVKLTHMRSQKIFSNHNFAKMLNTRAQSPHAYDSVYEMQQMCVIRISFVKGWGAEYNRQDATSTPCWIEMRLHGPLKLLDRVITQLPPPPSFVGSQS